MQLLEEQLALSIKFKCMYFWPSDSTVDSLKSSLIYMYRMFHMEFTQQVVPMPGSMLGTRDKAVSKYIKGPSPGRVYMLVEGDRQ